MKKVIAIGLVLAAQFSNASTTVAPDAAECSAKINGKMSALVYNSEMGALQSSKDGINVNVLVFNIDGQIRASVAADLEGQSNLSQTAPIPVAKKGGSPFLAALDFGNSGTASIFCTLK